MTKIAYLPHFIDPKALTAVQTALQRLAAGERAGLRLEKIHTSGLYSIRLNQADRLLLIKKQGQWVAVELVLNHVYERARALQPGVLKQMLGTQVEFSEIDWDAQSGNELLPAEAEWEPIPPYFYDGIPIILDESQSTSLRLKLPSLVIGPPGCGKTTVCMTVLQQFIHASGLENPKIIYVVPTPQLRLQLDAVWRRNNPLAERAKVHFCTYGDLIAESNSNAISAERFNEWLNNAIKPLKKQYTKLVSDWGQFCQKTDEIRFEFSFLQALGQQAYLENTELPNCFPAQKELILDLYKKYVGYLTTNKLHDPNLTALKTSTDQNLLIVDEGQAFSPFQHQELARLSGAHKAVFICMDKEQCIGTSEAIERFVMQQYYHLTTRLTTHVLNVCYRCPEPVIRAANQVLAFGQGYQPPKTAHHYRALVAARPGQGEFRLLDQTNLEQADKEALIQLCQSPNTLVLAFGAELRSDFVTQLGCALTLSPRQALGFDAETVILVNPFANEDARNFARSNQDNPANLRECAWFRALFVAVTRAERRLYILHTNQREFSGLLKELRTCDTGPQQQAITAASPNDAIQWLAQYQNALAQGLLGIANKIRAAHPEIEFPEPMLVPASPPVSANAGGPATRKTPKLERKDLEAWLKLGTEQLKEKLGLKMANKLAKLIAWLEDEDNAKRLLEQLQKAKTQTLRTLLKNELNTCYMTETGAKRAFSQFLASRSHCHALLVELLEGLTEKEKKDALPRLAEAEEASNLPWLNKLVTTTASPTVMALVHTLSDAPWFACMTHKTEHGHCFEQTHLDTENLDRMARILYKEKKWGILIDNFKDICRSQSDKKQGLPFLMRMMLWLDQTNQKAIYEALLAAILVSFQENQDDLFVLYQLTANPEIPDYQPEQTCLLAFCLDYLLDGESLDERAPEARFAFLKQSLINQCDKAAGDHKLEDALRLAVEPVRSVSLLMRLMANKTVQVLLTHLVLEYPQFRQGIMPLCQGKALGVLETYLLDLDAYMPGTVQLLHLITEGKTTSLDETQIPAYERLLTLVLEIPAPTRANQLKSLPVTHETDLHRIASYVEQLNRLVGQPVMGHDLLSRFKAIELLQEELLLGRQGIARLVLNQQPVEPMERLITLSFLMTCHNYQNRIMRPNQVEFFRWDQEGFIVLNRTRFLILNDIRAYENALIIGPDFKLYPFSQLPPCHRFLSLMAEDTPPKIETPLYLNTLAFKLDLCQRALGHLSAESHNNQSLQEARERCNAFVGFMTDLGFLLHVSPQLDRMPLALRPDWLADLLSQDSGVRHAATEKLASQINQWSFYQLREILLAPYDNERTIFEQMLALGSGTTIFNLINQDETGIKLVPLFLLLKETINTPSEDRPMVWERMIGYQDGLNLLNCLVSYLQHADFPCLRLYYDWLMAVLTPGNLGQGHRLPIQDLIIRMKSFNGPFQGLAQLCHDVLHKRVDDWAFALPAPEGQKVVPFIYFYLQPEYRDLGCFPKETPTWLRDALKEKPDGMTYQFPAPDGSLTTIQAEARRSPENGPLELILKPMRIEITGPTVANSPNSNRFFGPPSSDSGSSKRKAPVGRLA